jgi:hypothetical protein
MGSKTSKSLIRTELAREIKEREKEVLRLKAAVGKIPMLEGEIAVLQGSLKLFQGHDEVVKMRPQSHLFNNDGSNNGAPPLSSIVYKILKQANRPLGAGEVVALGPTNGKTINYRSLTSMMSVSIKSRKQFYREGSGKDGKYGLLEWKE